jgi:predicted PurR-regulated permease PerM
MMVTSLPEPGKLVNSLVGVDGELLIPTAINVTQFLAGVISLLFILFAFSMYAAQDQNRFLRLWLTLIPAHQRGPIRTAWLAADQAVGRYLRQQLSLGLVAALLLGLGYGLFGLPYPAGLALLTFFFLVCSIDRFRNDLNRCPSECIRIGMGCGSRSQLTHHTYLNGIEILD